MCVEYTIKGGGGGIVEVSQEAIAIIQEKDGYGLDYGRNNGSKRSGQIQAMF